MVGADKLLAQWRRYQALTSYSQQQHLLVLRKPGTIILISHRSMLPYYCFYLIVFVTLTTIALFTQRKLRNKKRDSQMFFNFLIKSVDVSIYIHILSIDQWVI